MERTVSSPIELEYKDDFFEWEERDNSISYINHCIAGSFAGVIEHVSFLPFDTIKTNMQVAGNNQSTWQTAAQMYRNEGFMKFWRGGSVLASGCIPAHAAYFSIYEFAKTNLLPDQHDQKDEIHPHTYALTGAFATMAHDLIITPFDTLKQRAQIAPGQFGSTKRLLKYAIRHEGFSSLFRSFPVTLLMNAPQAAALVCVNESLKILYRPKDGHHFMSYFTCAAIAGAFTSVITIPFDNIRTRLQTQNFYAESRSINFSAYAPNSGLSAKFKDFAMSIKYRNILDTIMTIQREEGFRGFFKGVFPRMVSQAPAAAISWSAYEMAKKFLNGKGGSQN